MLEVRNGKTIAIATRQAVPGDDLRRLESEVLVQFRRQLAEEQAARKDARSNAFGRTRLGDWRRNMLS